MLLIYCFMNGFLKWHIILCRFHRWIKSIKCELWHQLPSILAVQVWKYAILILVTGHFSFMPSTDADGLSSDSCLFQLTFCKCEAGKISPVNVNVLLCTCFLYLPCLWFPSGDKNVNTWKILGLRKGFGCSCSFRKCCVTTAKRKMSSPLTCIQNWEIVLLTLWYQP